MRTQRRPLPQVVVDAATRPLNLIGAAGMVAAAIVLGFHVGVALLVYALLVVASIVDIRSAGIDPGSYSAREVLLTLPPQLRTRISGVLSVADDIRVDLDLLDVEPTGVRDGLDQLSITLLETAQRAHDVDEYLRTVSRDDLEQQLAAVRRRGDGDDVQRSTADALAEQLAVIEGLADRRSQLDSQIEQIAASLGVIKARVVQARVESAGQIEVEAELGELRDRTRALAESFAEVNAAGDLAAIGQGTDVAGEVRAAAARAESSEGMVEAREPAAAGEVDAGDEAPGSDAADR